MRIRIVIGVSVVASIGNYVYQTFGDSVPGFQGDEFLTHLQEQRTWVTGAAAPYISSNAKIWATQRQLFPGSEVSDQLQAPPNLHPVRVTMLGTAMLNMLKQGTSMPHYDHLYVGGPPALAAAVDASLSGKVTLFVSPEETHQPKIANRSAFHLEPDVASDASALKFGNTPLGLLKKTLLEFIQPSRYDREASSNSFDWLRLNLWEWLLQPQAWVEGLIFLTKAQILAHQHDDESWQEKFGEMQNRLAEAGVWYQHIHDNFMPILGEQTGSAIQVDSAEGEEDFVSGHKTHGTAIVKLDNVTAQLGFTPVGADERAGFYNKTTDRHLVPDAFERLTQLVAAQGKATVQRNQQLALIQYVPQDKQEEMGYRGVAYFKSFDDGKIRPISFNHVTCSLGDTNYTPENDPMISVTGVSMTGLLFLSKESDLRCPYLPSGTIHLTPLGSTIAKVSNPDTGTTQEMRVVLTRVTAGASIAPDRRGKRHQDFDSRTAYNMIHEMKRNIPGTFVPLTVRGCNRKVGVPAETVVLPLNPKNTGEFIDMKVRSPGGGGWTQGTLAFFAPNKAPLAPDFSEKLSETLTERYSQAQKPLKTFP